MAPVLTEGATSRDIYLPAGVWYEEGDLEKPIQGPTWIRNYPAPLDVLPYFVRDNSVSHDSSVSLYTSAILVVLGLITNIIAIRN